MTLVRTPPWPPEYHVAKADGPSNIRSDCGPRIPAISAFTRVFDALCAGMNGSETLRRAIQARFGAGCP